MILFLLLTVLSFSGPGDGSMLILRIGRELTWFTLIDVTATFDGDATVYVEPGCCDERGGAEAKI